MMKIFTSSIVRHYLPCIKCVNNYPKHFSREFHAAANIPRLLLTAL